MIPYRPMGRMMLALGVLPFLPEPRPREEPDVTPIGTGDLSRLDPGARRRHELAMRTPFGGVIDPLLVPSREPFYMPPLRRVERRMTVRDNRGRYWNGTKWVAAYDEDTCVFRETRAQEIGRVLEARYRHTKTRITLGVVGEGTVR